MKCCFCCPFYCFIVVVGVVHVVVDPRKLSLKFGQNRVRPPHWTLDRHIYKYYEDKREEKKEDKTTSMSPIMITTKTTAKTSFV